MASMIVLGVVLVAVGFGLANLTLVAVRSEQSVGKPESAPDNEGDATKPERTPSTP